jgi:hypothetical protein
MGMFDTLHGSDGSAWQTKAFKRLMCDYETGDKIPGPNFCTYQVEICGGMPQESKHSYATIGRM